MSDPLGEVRVDEAFADTLIRWVDGRPSVAPVDDIPVSLVPIKLLHQGNSVRSGGEDLAHTHVLAETETGLPPIIVHRASMRVIDGMHRLRAAILKGRTAIEARILDCDEDTAFLLAVACNIRHGLTLTSTDRKAAAERVIGDHPEWSDRAVAAATGLSANTVAVVRQRCSTAEAAQSNTRLGKDGRVRPLDSAASRRQAAAMLRDNPQAGLREIARATGLSPATVSDVRKRAARGEDPVPDRYRRASREDSEAGTAAGRARVSAVSAPDRDALLSKLRNDPALRYSDTGRQTLRWLYQHMIDPDSGHDLAANLPEHWLEVVAALALDCAQTWSGLAARLHEQARTTADQQARTTADQQARAPLSLPPESATPL